MARGQLFAVALGLLALLCLAVSQAFEISDMQARIAALERHDATTDGSVVALSERVSRLEEGRAHHLKMIEGIISTDTNQNTSIRLHSEAINRLHRGHFE